MIILVLIKYDTAVKLKLSVILYLQYGSLPFLKIWEKYQTAVHLVILKPWPAAGHFDTAIKFISKLSEVKLVSNSEDSEDTVNFTWISIAINTK